MIAIMKTKYAKRRETQVQALLKLHGLSPAHLRAARHGSHWQPYHNYQHAYMVTLAAVEAAIREGLPMAQVKHVLLAGLYHAYRHTADYRTPADANLKRAFNGARLWTLLHGRHLSRQDRERVLQLIVKVGQSDTKVPQELAVHILLDAIRLADLGPEADLWFEARAKENLLPVTAMSVNEELTDMKFYTAWGYDRVAQFQRDHNFERPGLSAVERDRLAARLATGELNPRQPSSIDSWLQRNQRSTH